ncbi:MAG: beta-lactamase family protein [Acidobacteriaceae bacterium]|nr:beta-lactamase family protein [Acidobacteriaceae bacterium]MBV9501172.1 beta-lactamase family protein [Acidobacteriaceae bacterium]
MTKLQFRVLYREFLFRIIDLELLAPQGDIGKLLGQFAALLLFVGLWVLLPTVIMSEGPPSELTLLVTWTAEHFIIATTMLVVGLFAVLSWESMFPDRRDIMVLAPLPVQARTVFLAKVATVTTSLGLTVICLNILPGLLTPFAFSTAPVLPPPKYEAAMPPVHVTDLQPVLDRDMVAAWEPTSGRIGIGKDAGVAIGVVEHGVRRVFTYGTANADSIFEIGSITKTFTGLLLARMVEQRKVSFNEPVRELLPEGIVPKPNGPEITLLDLATQHSGLPPMPDNFNPLDRTNPYADYRAADLYAFMAKRGVTKPVHPGFLYSNLGLGLLGQALANSARTTYAKLLKQEITGSLGMRDTVVSLSPEQWERFIQGHSGNAPHNPVHAWDLDALAGAGGIRSTAGDMLTYLEAQLHPERFPTLSAPLTESHQLRASGTAGHHIALAWNHDDRSGIFGHNGATGGFTSHAIFDPTGDYAIVVLLNTGPNLALSPERVGGHIRQRLMGRPAVSLASPLLAGKAAPWSTLRSFGAYWVTLFAAGAFLFSSVLTLQGLAQLLPRQILLRVSSFLQLACFCLFLLVYFLQPPFGGLEVLVNNQGLLPWLPSYWFFSLFQALNGSLPSELAPLAERAWTGLAISLCGAAGAYTICYLRTLQKIAEQPDILPAPWRLRWLPRFGNSLETVVGQFAVRTLFRSPQHRVVLTFYLGIALGLGIFISKAPVLGNQSSAGDVWYQMNAPLLVASILIMCAAALGTRVVFSMPLELRANWIFRVTPPPAVPECLAATRRALYGLALAPVLGAMAALFFGIWPWRAASAHLAILALVGMILSELSLRSFQKIPFTCSYLPGKSYFHMAALAFVAFAYKLNKGAALERSALEDPRRYAALIAVLAIAVGVIRWRTAVRAKSEEAVLHFEDEPEPAILTLGLQHHLAALDHAEEQLSSHFLLKRPSAIRQS